MARTEQLRLIAKRYMESTGVDCALSEAKAMSAQEQSCVPTATGVHGNGRFNRTGMAVAPVPIAAAIN